ncbi:TRAP transporter small permease [Jiella sonneratiae]|uniref:TRAP transporter small permease protein n=1 Tax=Jiella sonneratiae TaxID=2816856 RepID=A0ABS3J3H8_9HYPH|nr:TRAP transporter small permease [Jiella sonneratiae]MBO0903533.1 TRAP transporter small permease [Jiella sonneratiae]
MRKIAVNAAERLIALTHNLAAVLLAVAALLVFWQVVTRFLLGDAAAWSEVLARGVVIWMVFLVAGAGFRLSAMIPLEFVRSVLPDTLQRVVGFVVMALILVFLGVLIWFGTAMAIRVSTQQVAMLGVPISWFYAAIPLGAALAVPGVLLEFFRPIDELRDAAAARDETFE